MSLSETMIRFRGAMLQLRYYFLRHITGFFGFLFAVKVGVVFQFLARPFISRRHVELCASCFWSRSFQAIGVVELICE